MIGDIIRGEIGFGGFLMTDDIGMGALDGEMAARCEAALTAGCDAILHCSGEYDEMQAVGAVVPQLTAAAQARWRAATAQVLPTAGTMAAAELSRQLSELIERVGVGIS